MTSKEFTEGGRYHSFVINRIVHHPLIKEELAVLIYCTCDCGRRMVYRRYELRKRKSCGCKKGNTKYSNVDKRVYSTWRNMKIRCFCKTTPGYKKYGAKGVTVCSGLLDFNKFQILLGVPPSESHSLDRFPLMNGGYYCGGCSECMANGWELNVRWADKKQQAENRGICYSVELGGATVTLKEACRVNGLPYRHVHERIKRGGWDINTAINTPMGKPHSYKKIKK